MLMVVLTEPSSLKHSGAHAGQHRALSRKEPNNQPQDGEGGIRSQFYLQISVGPESWKGVSIVLQAVQRSGLLEEKLSMGRVSTHST
jgi:hypothetical protein